MASTSKGHVLSSIGIVAMFVLSMASIAVSPAQQAIFSTPGNSQPVSYGITPVIFLLPGGGGGGGGGGSGASTGANAVPCTILQIYTDVLDTIYILGIMLMILGGAVYAAAHIMPGQTKGTLQGYGMGLLMGGIIGVIIAVLVPFIFGVLTSNTPSAFVTTATTQFGCP